MVDYARMRIHIISPVAALAVLAALVVAAPATAAIHVVEPGESLTSVAALDGLSISQLAAANGLSTTSQLLFGQTLVIPPQTAAAVSSDGTAAVAAPATTSTGGSYVVQPGDSLTAVAARAGTTVASLAAANGLDPSAYLLIGTVLNLNGLAATSTGAVTPATTSEPPTTPSIGGPPYPTPETVSSSEIGSIAAANGVPSSLAAAIGWQESGFNNDLTSPTGAVGVMQIEPPTWAWIQDSLAGGGLGTASAHDNVLGGVLLLHHLLADTGGDAALAAAGYYQGLTSVRQSGMYPSTQSYVNDVLALQQNQFGGP